MPAAEHSGEEPMELPAAAGRESDLDSGISTYYS